MQVSLIADELKELREKEREQGIQPDPEIDAFMKANAIEGKRESIETDYVLHVLGLNVCADTMVSPSAHEAIHNHSSAALFLCSVL